jgi:hypothetical protein
LIEEWLTNGKRMPHLADSSDLAPDDYFLFGSMKRNERNVTSQTDN